MKSTVLTSFLISVASCALAPAAQAQAWPQPGKPVQLIVPAPGGGGTGDTIARLLAEQLGRRLGTTVIVDNRGGANGNIGAAAAAAAAPDGYRLLFSWAGTLAVNPSLYRNLSFDPQTDFVPVGLVADVPNILVVNKDLPVKSLGEFVSYAKTHPGKINYGSTGSGSSMHLAGALMAREAGLQMTHVPYTAPGQATTNLISNEIQAMFQLVPGIVGQVRGGTVQPLAVMATTRSPALPDVPTTKEMGFPQLLSSTWFAVLAPKDTPVAVVERLNKEINAILADRDVRSKLADMGASPLGGTRHALAEKLEQETRKWQLVVRDAGIQVQ
jgi:tripartite-type tricarboxylate transporter receptor subunit TctC